MSCGNPAEPLPVRTVVVTPQLAELVFESWRMRDGGVVEVYGVPVDQNFRLGHNEYAVVRLESTAGELEALSLEPYACRDDGIRIFICRGFAIGMHDGFHASSIEASLNELDVNLTLVSPSGIIGGAWSFANDTGRVRRAIATLPGVRLVDYSELFFLQSFGASRYDVFATLIAVGRFRVASPVARNGVIEATPGDTITVWYDQPNGAISSDTVR
jgi:hypothetical protein